MKHQCSSESSKQHTIIGKINLVQTIASTLVRYHLSTFPQCALQEAGSLKVSPETPQSMRPPSVAWLQVVTVTTVGQTDTVVVKDGQTDTAVNETPFCLASGGVVTAGQTDTVVVKDRQTDTAVNETSLCRDGLRW